MDFINCNYCGRSIPEDSFGCPWCDNSNVFSYKYNNDDLEKEKYEKELRTPYQEKKVLGLANEKQFFNCRLEEETFHGEEDHFYETSINNEKMTDGSKIQPYYNYNNTSYNQNSPEVKNAFLSEISSNKDYDKNRVPFKTEILKISKQNG